MKFILTFSVALLVVIAYSAGVIMGWDAGVRDGQNLVTVQTP